jgi:hypothetical protein
MSADELQELRERAFKETSLHPNVIMAKTAEELKDELTHQRHDKVDEDSFPANRES